MTRLLRADAVLLAALLASGALIGALEADERQTQRTITDELEPLRSAFNADPGAVRAILLASPT